MSTLVVPLLAGVISSVDTAWDLRYWGTVGLIVQGTPLVAAALAVSLAGLHLIHRGTPSGLRLALRATTALVWITCAVGAMQFVVATINEKTARPVLAFAFVVATAVAVTTANLAREQLQFEPATAPTPPGPTPGATVVALLLVGGLAMPTTGLIATPDTSLAWHGAEMFGGLGLMAWSGYLFASIAIMVRAVLGVIMIRRGAPRGRLVATTATHALLPLTCVFAFLDVAAIANGMVGKPQLLLAGIVAAIGIAVIAALYWARTLLRRVPMPPGMSQEA